MKYSWWILQAVMTAVCVFFLFFGIDLLMAAYSLNDPFNFIMTFFAASFIILISLTMAVTCVIKMVRVWKQIQKDKI